MQNQNNRQIHSKYLLFGFVMLVTLGRVLYHGMSVPGEMISTLIVWGFSCCMILGLIFFMTRMERSSRQFKNDAETEQLAQKYSAAYTTGQKA